MTARRAGLALVLVILAGSPGCSLTTGQSNPSKKQGTPSGTTRTLPRPGGQPPPPRYRLTPNPSRGANAGVDFAAYDASLNATVNLIDAYWRATLPREFGKRYTPPAKLIAYYPRSGEPRCGGERVGAKNAVYCTAGGFIAWDEPGLLVPYYREKGAAADAYVLAHEWGHLVQHDLGVEDAFKHTIEAEQNADCLAGAFAGAQARAGRANPADVPAVLIALFEVGDSPLVPWRDPAAHGTPDFRTLAFTTGVGAGPRTCMTQYGPGFTERPGSLIPPSDSALGDVLGLGRRR